MISGDPCGVMSDLDFFGVPLGRDLTGVVGSETSYTGFPSSHNCKTKETAVLIVGAFF